MTMPLPYRFTALYHRVSTGSPADGMRVTWFWPFLGQALLGQAWLCMMGPSQKGLAQQTVPRLNCSLSTLSSLLWLEKLDRLAAAVGSRMDSGQIPDL